MSQPGKECCLRVLVIEAAGNLWGSERVLLDMLANRKGSEYAVCCPPNTPIISELEKLGVTVLPFFIANLHQKSKWQRAKAVVGVLRACRRFRPQVVYLNQSGCYRIAALACRLFGIPMVAHVRIVEDAAYLAGCRPDPVRLKSIVAISHWIRGEIQKVKQVANIPVHTLYDGYQPACMESFDAVCHKPSGLGQIACVGRVQKIKGQDLLLDALAILKTRRLLIQCQMVGDGEDFYWEQLERTCALGLQEQVKWTGFLANPRQALRNVRLLILPSHREPLGRVIFEAWEMGMVPVVFTGSGGAAEVIESSGGGILYAHQEPVCLAEAIQQAITFPDDVHAALVRRGRAWMAEHTDSVKYAAAMESIFLKSIQP
jgi:glycosyltransferase involved in cell wall biosynthesis